MIPSLPFMTSSATIFTTLLAPSGLRGEKAGARGLDRPQFDAALAAIEESFGPLVKALGGTLAFAPDWDDDGVNAMAQRFDDVWLIRVSGGLARRAEMSKDAFTLALCHELGHHLAGFPFSSDSSWSAAEGQADYFATQVCVRRLWRQEPSPEPPAEAPPEARERCRTAFGKGTEEMGCLRSAVAALRLTSMFAAARKIPAPTLATPDPAWVAATAVGHPEPQCRLDTFLAGSLCPLENSLEKIAGLAEGRNSLGAELASAATSCHEGQGRLAGARPRCWFFPRWAYDGASLSTPKARASENPEREVAVALPGEALRVSVALALWRVTSVPGGLPPPRDAVDSSLGVKSLSSSLAVVSPSLPIPRMEPGQGAVFTSEPLLRLAPDARCGDEARVQLTWTVGDAQVVSRLGIPIGILQPHPTSYMNLESPIPDGGRFLEVAHEEPDGFGGAKAIVEVDFSHPFPGDLVWRLTTPGGRTVDLERNWLGAPGRHARTFSVPLDERDSRGTWALAVRDTARGDAGVLHGWKLTLVEGVCSREPIAPRFAQ